ncbi:MAG: hypothetical protein DRN15_08465 [Thermoprotei archaeon]|mgnify:CR=1 FL=1|nr:MAG: hypothetical protein DRN15_08465 [Thermoprotei archaeon]
MSSKELYFTETEKEILRHYLKGVETKRIADLVKCSIRTVYKALYKYRKALRSGYTKYDVMKAIGLLEEQVVDVTKQAQQTSSALYTVQSLPLSSPQTRVIPFLTLTPILQLPVAMPSAQEINELKKYISELVIAIKGLEETMKTFADSISDLNALLRELKPSLYRRHESHYISKVHGVDYRDVDESLPSYLRDNPWIEILSKRGID